MSAESYFDDVQKLYIAYYGRPADPEGLVYWASALDEQNGSYQNIIDAFANSTEAAERFGSLSSEETIRTLYNQLFNRDPESPEVVDWWVGKLENDPHVTSQSIALDLLYGAQNQDAEMVANKLSLASDFTTYLSANSLEQVYQGSLAAHETAGWLTWTTVNGGLSAGKATYNIYEILSGIGSEPAFYALDNHVTESDGTATVTVVRNSAYSSLALSYATDPVSAREDDFVATEGTIEFAPGETRKQISIDIINDGIDEPIEYFKLQLDDAYGNTDTARIYIGEEGPVAPFLSINPTLATTSYQSTVSPQGVYNSANPEVSYYHFISGLIPGVTYELTGNRLEFPLDPAMWIYSGIQDVDQLVANGNASGADLSGPYFEDNGPDYLGFGDDEVSHPGPYGDPRLYVTAPDSGEITVIFTNYLSEGDPGPDGRFGYRLDITNVDILEGTAGADSLNGSINTDVISGLAGDDTLSGGGGNDTFVFNPGHGADTISDFDNGDEIYLYGFDGLVDFDSLSDQIVAQGGDTLIELGNGDQIILLGVDPSSLDADAFLFGPG